MSAIAMFRQLAGTFRFVDKFELDAAFWLRQNASAQPSASLPGALSSREP